MAKHASETSSMELSHYLVVLRRRWWQVLAGLGVGLALAVAAIVVTPSSATSTTLVNVNLIATNAFNNSRPPSDLVDAQTEETMARSTEVMQGVADALGGSWTRSTVRRSTTATLLPDGTVVRIEFTAPTPTVAAQGATLVAEQYLAYRSSSAQSRVELATEPLVVRSNALKKQVAKKNAEVAGLPLGSAERAAAELAAEEIKTELAGVSAQIGQLSGVSTSGGEVLTEADPAQAASSPNRTMMLVSGTLGGLLLGLVAAFVVNVLDRRLLDPYDVAGAGGGDTLALLRGPRTEVPATGDDADQIRAVRERLFSSIEGERPVFGVIDVAPSPDHPTDVAVGLAVSLADAGVATDLVLADYPQHVVDEIAEALQAREVDTHGLGRRFRGGIAEHLTVVVPGAARPRISTSDLVTEMLDDAVRVAEATVVGVAPGAGAAARLTVARSAHLCVLAAREQDTSIDQLAGVVDDMRSVWATVHGTVLVPGSRTFAGLDAQPVEEPVEEPVDETEVQILPTPVITAILEPTPATDVERSPRDPFADDLEVDLSLEADLADVPSREHLSTPPPDLDEPRPWAFDR
ncbi:hypothetical protein [Nocardioides yefusunii]|uniref:Capsular polysaccharide biosynthesis protein n=1 Tax=Nocardioides yefusunii TaxID=2500546 RepID=A0ABW1QXZ3_9ACTN|nr:hypothetical protein [Nocardioides yefusunii]